MRGRSLFGLCPAYSRASCICLSVWISEQLLHVFIFPLLATHTERRKIPFKATFPSPSGEDDEASIRTIAGNLGRRGVFERMKAVRKHHYLVITRAGFHYLKKLHLGKIALIPLLHSIQ